MSLRARLAWAFVGVAFFALLLAFVGLNVGLYSSMARMHEGSMPLSHVQYSGPGG